MSLKIGKIYSAVILSVSVILTMSHIIWCFVDKTSTIYPPSMLIIAVAYGLPILIFVIVCVKVWRASLGLGVLDAIFLSVIAVIFITMVLHTTIDGLVKSDFINSYFNIPIIYTIPTAIIGIIWLLMSTHPTKNDKLSSKILYSLTLAAISAMVIHCGTLCIIHLADNGTTGAPWWVLPLVFGLAYLLLALVFYIAYYICIKVQRHKIKKF